MKVKLFLLSLVAILSMTSAHAANSAVDDGMAFSHVATIDRAQMASMANSAIDLGEYESLDAVDWDYIDSISDTVPPGTCFRIRFKDIFSGILKGTIFIVVLPVKAVCLFADLAYIAQDAVVDGISGLRRK